MAKNAASKVLIAEDNKATRRLLEMLLGKWGYEVIAVVDGNEAWEQLKDPDSPKLAILDWMMPGMNGIDVCRSKDLLVVHMANLLVKSMGYSMSGNGEIDVEKTESATLLKLDSATISSVKDRVNTQMGELKDYFS